MSVGMAKNGGGGMTMGSSAKQVKRDLRNQQVLDALRRANWREFRLRRACLEELVFIAAEAWND